MDVSASPWKLIYDREVLVYENQNFQPRAWLAGGMRTARNWQEIREMGTSEPARLASEPLFLAGRDADAARSALAKADAQKQTSAPAGLVRVKQRSASRYLYETQSQTGALLVVSNAALPGWRARVDGQPVEILRAFGCLQSLAVPAGSHKVEFVYAPASARVGCWVTLASAAALLAACYVCRGGRMEQDFSGEMKEADV